jgi:hypothetical protein
LEEGTAVSVVRGRGWAHWGWAFCALLTMALAGCGQTSEDVRRTLPGGVFTSQAYHFSVTYPVGWVANSNACGSAAGSCDVLAGTATVGAGQVVAVPLQLTITRADQAAATTPVVSSFAITVLDLRDPHVALAAQAITTAPGLKPLTLAGQPAFATTPVEQPLPGSNGTPGAEVTPGAHVTSRPTITPHGATSTRATITHTAYFLVHGGFEYQIGVDSVSNDGSQSALQAMLQSFTLTA